MVTAYIHWNVDPEIINIFGLSLRYYGLLFVGGLMVCIYVLSRIFKQQGIPLEHLEKLSMYGVIGVFVGARLGHCLFYDPVYYLTHIAEMLLPIAPAQGGGYEFVGYQGLASHGGAIGLIIAIIVYSRKTKEPALKTIDMMGIVAPLAGFFIRMANLMNSEIIGRPADVPWAFVFHRIDEIPRHPGQLYEALCYITFFGVMMLIYKKRWAKFQTGIFFGTSITLIFTARFFIEFLKERQESWEESMRFDMGQWLSVPFILVGIGFIVWGIYRTKKGFIPHKTVAQPTPSRQSRRKAKR
ncbi:MAG: prolipoprotein diacylglyceryl transferase [Cytophagaceae bacterium]|jgi:prolipoprotein diacylglyceryl transferase|nr:prolipoprotein diacylglyceryl transferase [Cytophagaceae bacterium]